MTNAETLRAADFEWHVDPDHREDLAPWLEDPVGFLEATPKKVIKQNSVRTVFFVRIGRRDYYVKRYAKGDATEQVKAKLGESKAEREWRIMSRGRTAGLPVPIPAAMGERRKRGRLEASYLATVSIDEAIDLVPFIEARLLEDRPAREAFLRELGAAVWQMHEAGLFHRDLHSGNVLIQHPDAAPADRKIHMIDLHRGSWRATLSSRARRWNLAFLLHSTSRVTNPDDRAACIDGYVACGGELGDRAGLLEWVEARVRRFERRRLRSRSKRCIVQSSQFRHEAVGSGDTAGVLYFAKSFGRACAERAIAEFVETGAVRLKRTARTEVKAVDVDGEPYVVKEYVARFGDRAGGGRGFRAWRNGNALLVRGVPVATPLAYLRRRSGGGFLVMARGAGERLDHVVIRLAEAHGERSPAFRAAVVGLRDATAALIRSMHERGIYHGDLKACNLLVDGAETPTPALTVIDYDRIAVPDRPLDDTLRTKNLAQLHAAVTTHVGRATRVGWFRRYSDEERWTRRRTIFAAITALCAEKIVVDREPIE